MSWDDRNWPHRTYCDVCAEIRKLIETATPETYQSTLSTISSLVEELQVYGNRMEAGLDYGRDIAKLHEDRKKLIQKVRRLNLRVKNLDEKVSEEDN